MAALRFKKFRLKSKIGQPRRVLSVRPVPTLVTLGNLICGFGAIYLCMRTHNPPSPWDAMDCLYWSGILLFVGMIFDVLDGRIARLTKSTSRFGLEMDSLCDVVSFGVAPAVIVQATIDVMAPDSWIAMGQYPILDRYVWMLMAVYVSCAALRLARYNVEASSGHSELFFGIPSPAAAGCVASLVVMITSFPAQGRNRSVYLDPVLLPPEITKAILIGLPFLMLLLGILMVTRVHYIHMGDRLLGGRKSFMHLMVLALGLVLVIMQHEIMLVLAFNGYMLSGLINEVYLQFFKVHPEAADQVTSNQQPSDSRIL